MRWFGVVLAIWLGVLSQWALGAATIIDLTAAGSSATVNGAIFIIPTQSVDASGSGVLDAFLRVQNSPSEQGYNSSDRPVQFDEDNGATTHNHDLTISQIATNKVVVNNKEYYEFVLDGHDSTGGSKEFLTLDQLQFFRE